MKTLSNDQSSNTSIKGGLLHFWHQFGVQMTAVLSMVVFSIALVVSLTSTPLFSEEEFGGLAQKIMYLHIPFAIISFVAFFFGFVAATLFLLYDDHVFDDYSRACMEAGFLYSFAVLVSGPLLTRPVWGVWWRFEPLLNTSLIMFCIYANYFVVPPFMDGHEIKEKFRSVVAVLGFMMVPVVFYSVYMVYSSVCRLSQRYLVMTSPMVWSIRLVMIALFLLFLCISWTRYRMLRLEHRLYRRMIEAK